MLSCKNCGTNFEGNYCPECGQKYIDKRFVLKDSIFWAFHSIFNFDKGFLYTSKEIITQPGNVINEFLNGITIRYAHPFRFIFIWATISALIGIYLGTFQETEIAVNKAMGMSEEAIERNKALMEMVNQYMSFVILILVPFYSISTAMLFKSKQLYFAEHLIINSFGQASAIIVGLPITLFSFFIGNPQSLSLVSFIVGLIVISRVYVKVFKVNWAVAILKYIIGFVITMILFCLTFVIILLIIVLTMKFLGIDNPYFSRPAPA